MTRSDAKKEYAMVIKCVVKAFKCKTPNKHNFPGTSINRDMYSSFLETTEILYKT